MLLAPALHETVSNAPAHAADVVESLATRGWCEIADFLPPADWQPMAVEVRLLYAGGGFRMAGVGHGKTLRVRPEIRNDRVRWIDPLEPSLLQQGWLARIEALRLCINAGLMAGLFDYEGHFALYPPGSFYRRHLDRFADVSYRTVTCILYLNDDWQPEDGGELRMYLPDGEGGERHVDILPAGGKAVFFLSGDFEHMVMPSKRERLSLTGWFCQRR